MPKYVQLFEKEKLHPYRNEYLISSDIIPTRQHQASEELLEFQKRNNKKILKRILKKLINMFGKKD